MKYAGTKKMFRVKIRPVYDGRPAKETMLILNGEVLEFSYGWSMDNDDPYPGEDAWMFPRHIPGWSKNMEYFWIASGDLEEP